MLDLDDFKNEFRRRFGSEPTIASAPGRVNLIGEHTDYNEGFVLPFAIDRRTCVGAALRSDELITVHTLTLDETAKIRPDAATESCKQDWTLYIRGMIAVLKRKGVDIAGADILIDSEIPFGAGLSSSAGLEISLGYALTTLSGRPVDLRDLAFAGQQVEHEFVGVRSGIMDQFASALARKGNALLIDCRDLSVEHVPLELGTAMLVICDTQVKHSLAASEYNQRRAECERGVEILSEKIPGIRSLRDVPLAEFDELKKSLPEVIQRRCRHVITENVRTLNAVAAIRESNLFETGSLMKQSHESLRDDYQVSCPELDLLAETANAMEGVYGARMTGGGFGGCTINLLETSAFDDFERRVRSKYLEGFGREPDVFVVRPSEGARLEK